MYLQIRRRKIHNTYTYVCRSHPKFWELKSNEFHFALLGVGEVWWLKWIFVNIYSIIPSTSDPAWVVWNMWSIKHLRFCYVWNITFGNLEGILQFFIFCLRTTVFRLLNFDLLICTLSTLQLHTRGKFAPSILHYIFISELYQKKPPSSNRQRKHNTYSVKINQQRYYWDKNCTDSSYVIGL